MTMPVFARPAAILLDIEGTISSLPHVVETHYPYTRKHIAAYLDAHRREPTIVKALAETRTLAPPGVAPLDALYKWIDEDAKARPLKLLQGLVWTQGYQSGELVGHIYPDAFAALASWRAKGVPLHVFSSGSVQCQVQFFQNCPDGDVSYLFAHHFDTRIGAKVEAASYGRIAAALRLAPSDILFFTDNPRELVAASSVGLRVVQVLRESLEADGRFPAVASFADVELLEAAA